MDITSMKTKESEECTQADPRSVTVDVSLRSDGNPPNFTLSSTEISITMLSSNGTDFQVLNFSNNHGGAFSDGFLITFNLIDYTGKGYGFFFVNPASPNPDDAIWVQKIDGDICCPTVPSTWGVFKPISVTRNSLVVRNPNGKLQYFGFALLLSLSGATAPSLVLDPIGNNQNGSSLRS